MLRTIAVFCGSSAGRDPRHAEAARALGKGLAERDLTLVYGGGRVGLMGELANAALAAGGRVVGVIPRGLMTAEVAHPGLQEMLVVETLYARKELMIGRADAFVTLAGGLGTLDELFEVVTQRQLGHHDKPCGLLNTGGFYTHLLRHVQRTVDEGFLAASAAGSLEELLIVRQDAGELLTALGA